MAKLPIPLDLKQLERRCRMTEAEYAAEFGGWTNNRPGEQYIYLDRGSPLLAVAHLDCHYPTSHFEAIELDGELNIFASNLDDRLGAYIILDVLPALGIVTDVLLTVGEEVGKSTAEFFRETHPYNWMVEFDRTGEDVVLYQFDTQKLRNRLQSVGFEVGYGSFSDIAFLDHLGVQGFNVGVGYYDYHSTRAYAIWEVTVAQIHRFVKFHQCFAGKRLKFDPPVYAMSKNGYGLYAGNSSFGEDVALRRKYDYGSCPQCGIACFAVELYEQDMCDSCFKHRNTLGLQPKKEVQTTFYKPDADGFTQTVFGKGQWNATTKRFEYSCRLCQEAFTSGTANPQYPNVCLRCRRKGELIKCPRCTALVEPHEYYEGAGECLYCRIPKGVEHV